MKKNTSFNTMFLALPVMERIGEKMGQSEPTPASAQ
jgi:hypothetical protein